METVQVPSEVKKLTSKQCKQLLPSLEKEQAKVNPFSLVEDGHLWIKTKEAKLIPLELNKAQRHVLSIIKPLWNENKIIRILLLKARQLGMSTLIEAIIYSLTSQVENVNADIIADEQKRSDNLFEMSKLYQEKCPDYIKPSVKKSNAKKLEFEGIHSQILVETANDPDAGRSFTFQLVHLSECARFRNNETLMLGLSQTVPILPHTMIIKETTANGFNHFKEEWDAATNKETDYLPIFIPWYWAEEYRMALAEGFTIGDRHYGEASKAEFELEDIMKKEGISDIKERLQWRRWCIRNNCGNKVVNFQQEYPSTPEEAFIASGDCAFDKEQLLIQLRKNIKPLARGNIVELDGKYSFRADPIVGDFKIYEPLKARSQEQYVIAGDACSGSGKDWATLVVIGKRSNNVVATYRMKVDSDVLAQKASFLGHFYHDAIIAIENNSYGFHANLKLNSLYGNVFKQEVIDKTDGKTTTKFGWNTNARTRPDMLGQLKQEVRAGATELRDSTLIREMLTFIRNPDNGKEEAQEGCQDDCVISRAIASAVRRLHPFEVPEPVYKDEHAGIPDY